MDCHRSGAASDQQNARWSLLQLRNSHHFDNFTTVISLNDHYFWKSYIVHLPLCNKKGMACILVISKNWFEIDHESRIKKIIGKICPQLSSKTDASKHSPKNGLNSMAESNPKIPRLWTICFWGYLLKWKIHFFRTNLI